MKKILIAFSGSRFSEGAFAFARTLNDQQRILLVGIFLPRAEMASLWNYGSVAGIFYLPQIEPEDIEADERNMAHFEKLCIGNDIDFRIRKYPVDFNLSELTKESRFADLLLMGSEAFYENIGAERPSEELKDALHAVSCPIIVVPEKYDFPNSNVLAFDGSDESVFAIKQFAYLFPMLAGRKTLLVYANEKEEADFPDKIQIEELAARHFSNLSLFKLDADPGKYFAGWLSEKSSAILVCGAYSRSGVSRLFRKSFVTEIIAEHRLPVFIAHK